MPGPLNPPCRLRGTPTNGCLHQTDGQEFSDLLQIGRLSTNAITQTYPYLTQPNHLVAAYSSQPGQMVLTHLSAGMYTNWDAAPSGPSAFERALELLHGRPLEAVCRAECAVWGTRRLNAPAGEDLVVVQDTPTGTIVADHSQKRFYKVLGLKTSPAAALKRAGITLPAETRLTALPFRGALVYDGLIGGSKPRTLDARAKKTLLARYKKVQREGTVITGFHADAPAPDPCPSARSVGESNLSAMSVSELKHFIETRGASAAECVEKSDLVAKATSLLDQAPTEQTSAQPQPASRSFEDLSALEKEQVQRMKAVSKRNDMLVIRRFGYSEKENPNHMAVLMMGKLACGSFTTAALVPSKEEVLAALVKLADESNALAKMVAVDDKATALAVNEVTKHAKIQVGFYPPPSVEEKTFLESVPPMFIEALQNFGAPY